MLSEVCRSAVLTGSVAAVLAGVAACGSAGPAPRASAPQPDSLRAGAVTVSFRVSCTRCLVRYGVGWVHSLESVEGSWSLDRSLSAAQERRRPRLELTVEPRDDGDVVRGAAIVVDGEVGAESGAAEAGEAVFLRAEVG